MDLFLSIPPFMLTNEMELLNAQHELFLMVLNWLWQNLDSHCHDLIKQLSHYLYLFSFLFFSELTTQE